MLRDYVQIKLRLAAQVRSLRETLRRQDDNRRLRRCDSLMVKLAEDRFTLAVLGQFKRGKSSLMNSIVGREFLPVGVLPLTSAITVLRFGASERLLIQRQRWSMLQEVPIGQLADYVTERGNPGNREQVEAAYLELPLMLLRRGVEFVDTPGVGSSVAANTATTYNYLPQCDAALFVTSADAPLNTVELGFLKEVQCHAAKMFFVVNKIDLLNEAERDEVLAFVRKALREHAGIENPRVFPFSALEGLRAKQAGNEALLSRSGLVGLESALADFLTNQKTAVFLSSVFEKTAQLVRGAQGDNELDRRANLLTKDELSEREMTLQLQLKEQAAGRAQVLDRLRKYYQEDVRERVEMASGPFFEKRASELPRQLERLLANAGRLPGRETKRRVAGAVDRLLARSIRLDLRPDINQRLSISGLRSCSDWHLLRTNLAGITKASAQAYGVAAPSDEDPDLVPPIEPANPALISLEGPRWAPSTRGPIGWMPGCWTRARIAAFLRDEGCFWLRAYQAAVADAAAQVANKGFDDWVAVIDSLASSLEHRSRPGLPTRKDIEGVRTALVSIEQHLERLRKESKLDIGPEGEFSKDSQPTRAEVLSIESTSQSAKQSETFAKEGAVADLKIRGCPVCSHVARVSNDFLSKWQYEIFARESAQNDFANDLGFCSRHQWQLEAISSPVGLSIGQAKLVRRVGRLLSEAAHQTEDARALAVGAGNHPCRVCRLEKDAETDYIGRMAAFLQEASGREAYAKSQGVCLHHLNRLVAILKNDELAKFVLAHEAKRFEELAEDMESYGMKTEALRRQLRNANEEDAYWRATILLVGGRSVCAPWPKEDLF